MAIDDNTSYELTGAQVKDLANKIKAKAADNIFVGATSAAPGSKGLVPQPQAGDNTKFLSGDGTWKTVGGGGDQKIYVTMGSWNSDGNKCTLTLYSDEALTQTMAQSDFKAIANSSNDVTFVFVDGTTTPARVIQVSYASYLQIWEPGQHMQYSLVRYWINNSLYTTSDYSQNPHIDWDSRDANAQLIFAASWKYVPLVDSGSINNFVLAGYSKYQNDADAPDSTNRYASGWFDPQTNRIYFELDTGIHSDGFPRTVELLDKNSSGQYIPMIKCSDRYNSQVFTPVAYDSIPSNCSVDIEWDMTTNRYGDPTMPLRLKFTINPMTGGRFEGPVSIILKGIEIGFNMNP